MREFLAAFAFTVAIVFVIIVGFKYGLGIWLDDDWRQRSNTTKIPGQSCYILEEYEQDQWDHDTRNYSKKVVCER